MNTKQLFSVYKIDLSVFEELSNNEAIINQIINKYNGSLELKLDSDLFEKSKYKPIDIKDNVDLKGFRCRIFYGCHIKKPSWVPLLNSISDLVSAENILNINYSLIVFIYNDRNIYAVTKGGGNFVIQTHIESFFGLNILSSLIDRNDKVVKSIQDYVLTGSIQTNKKDYRGGNSISNDEDFGKLFKQIIAKLPKEIVETKLSLSSNNKQKTTGCDAKASIQLKRLMNFDTLLNLIATYDQILERSEYRSFNTNVTRLDKRNLYDQELIKKLDTELAKKIKEIILDGENHDIDIAPSDFEIISHAMSYKIRVNSKFIERDFHDEVLDIKELRKILIVKNYLQSHSSTIEKFQKAMKVVKLDVIDITEKIVPLGSLFSHVNCDLTFEGNYYYRLHKEWFRVNTEFISSLNSKFQEIIDNKLEDSVLRQPMDTTKSEYEYNVKYTQKEGYLVLDKLLINYIEICDIMRFENDNVYLIHVKKDFDNKIREVSNQILVSLNYLLREYKTSLENCKLLFEQIYDKLASMTISSIHRRMQSNQINEISKEDFVNNYSNRFFASKLVPCLAFCVENNRSISEVDLFKSNIAKFSVISLDKDVSDSSDLKIVQIKSEQNN